MKLNLKSRIQQYLERSGYQKSIDFCVFSEHCNNLESIPYTSIVIPTWDRPEYLHRALTSIGGSVLDNALLFIIDDHSTDPETKRILKNFSCEAPTVVFYKNKRSNMNVSLDIGWSLAMDLGCKRLTNLDSDVLVKPNWLTVIQNLFDTVGYRKDRLLVSGFNRFNNPDVFADHDHYVVKKRMGGINYYFEPELFDVVKLCLAHELWDSMLQQYMYDNRKHDFKMVATKPSVIQHIGKEGTNTRFGFDYSIDFDRTTRTRYVISRRNTGLGDCLVSLFSAWLFARKTNRVLVIDWRFTPYSIEGEKPLFSHLFSPIEKIDGVQILELESVTDDLEKLSVYPPDRNINNFGQPTDDPAFPRLSDKEEVLDLCFAGEDPKQDIVIFDHCLNWNEMLGTRLSEAFFNNLEPSVIVKNHISTIERSIKRQPVIGVHIRHGNQGNIMNHRDYWENAGVEDCMETISGAVESIDEPSQVFLATDSLEIEEQLRSRFPELVSQNKFFKAIGEGELHFSTDNSNVAVEAAADLFMLSASAVLIRFPHISFFSQVAYELSQYNKTISEKFASLPATVPGYRPLVSTKPDTVTRSCLIAFRNENEHRLSALYFVLKQLSQLSDAEIILIEQDVSASVEPEKLPENCAYRFVYNDGPFNRSWAINMAAKIATGEILIVHDADMFLGIHELEDSIAQIHEGIEAVNPYDTLIDLNVDESAKLLSGSKQLDISRTNEDLDRQHIRHVLPFCGGIYIITRELYFAVGGMDERFQGWGAEDNAMEMRIEASSRKIRTDASNIAFHIWHGDPKIRSDPSNPSYVRNTALISAYYENGPNYIKSLRRDARGTGDPLKYSREKTQQAQSRLPLVSCLCVTRNRVPQLKQSITCFKNQNYPKKELVIVCDEDDSETISFLESIADNQIRHIVVPVTENHTLGYLRNLSIRESQGEYFCQWDDDDIFDPRRISRQLSCARQHSKAACFLSRWLILSEKEKKLYRSNARIWEGSILCKRDFLKGENFYGEQSRGEEAPLIRRLLASDQAAMLDDPELYLYRYSGENTWGSKHFQKILNFSTALGEDDYQKAIKRVSEVANFKASATIPKAIYQTAESEPSRGNMLNWNSALRALHPDWDYHFFDDQACRTFIADEMPELLNCYDSLTKNIQRVDLFRLAVLYVRGGFYVDTDMELKKPLDPLVSNECVFAVEKQLDESHRKNLSLEHGFRIANYMFGATAKNDFLAKLIIQIADHALERVIELEDDILESTGPGMVTNLYHQYEEKEKIHLLPLSGLICNICQTNSCTFGDYAIHHHLGTWRWQSSQVNSETGEKTNQKSIHQTWKSSNLPDEFNRLSKSWIDNHKSWNHYLWTDIDNRNLIQTHYPWFLETYDNYPFEIQRVDAARYFILYSLGGLYVDLDFRCFRPLDSLLQGSEFVVGLENKNHCKMHKMDMIVGNAFMYAPSAGNPFLRFVINEMANSANIPANSKNYILNSTGPFMLTRAYEKYENKEQVKLIPSELIYPVDYFDAEELLKNTEAEEEFASSTSAYAAHYHCGTWWKDFN